jgi:hypothetical protein
VTRRIVTPSGTSPVGAQDDRHWYRHALGDPHTNVKAVSYAKALLVNAANMHSKNRARENIYEGRELSSNQAALAAIEISGISVAKLNATKSIIDTFVSRLAKERPMPQIDVTGEDWHVKQRSRLFRQHIVAEWTELELDELFRDGLLDASILGNAFVRIDNNDNDAFAERQLVNETLFDERECKYGTPSQAFRIHRVSRDYLCEIYKDCASMIKIAPPSLRRQGENQSEVASMNLEDYVDLYEAWHLPSTRDSGDGRHGHFLENVTLANEEWLEPRFPWSMIRLFKPRSGLFGSGFVDQLASLQHRVNCIVRDLQLNLAATGRGHFLVNEQNDIPTEQLTGWQPFKLKFKGGVAPTYVTPTPFNQAQLNALEFFINKMYDLTGVSQANATSKSALGPGASGIALDTQYDIDSDRFRMPQGNYARARLHAGQCLIDASTRVKRKREADKGKKSSTVAVSRSWKDRDAIDRLHFDKVALAEGSYKLKIEAQNFLPDTRSGKLAIVEQLAKAGVIEQWLVPTLFDEPDLVQANGLLLAPFRNAMKKMDIIMDPAKPMPVVGGYNDVELELKIATAYVNKMEEEEAPPEIQDRYRRYADMCTEAVKERKSAALLEGSAAGPGALPMGPSEQPLPGGVPAMPTGPVPPPAMIGAPVA